MRGKCNCLKAIYCITACVFILAGCSDSRGGKKEIFLENNEQEMTKIEVDSVSTEANTGNDTESMAMEPEIVDADWSGYFNGSIMDLMTVILIPGCIRRIVSW